MLTRDEVRSIADRIFKLGRYPEMGVNVWWRQNCHTRFANNHITTAGFTVDLHVTVEVTQERKTGSTSTTETSDEALTRAVRKAEELATLAPPNPEYIEPLGPQNYPEIPAYDEASANARSDALLPAVRTTIEAVEAKQLNTFGYFEVDASAHAIANTKGLFGYHQRTWADYSATVRTPDGSGSGWAESQTPRLAQVDVQHVETAALRKAVESQKPRRLEPGKYTVILEPAALDEMLWFVDFDARAADEGRSFLSKRGGGNLLGEKVLATTLPCAAIPSIRACRDGPGVRIYQPKKLPGWKRVW